MNFGVYPFQKLQHLVRIAEAEARLSGAPASDADREPVGERSKSRFVGGIVAYVDGQRRLRKLRHEGENVYRVEVQGLLRSSEFEHCQGVLRDEMRRVGPRSSGSPSSTTSAGEANR